MIKHLQDNNMTYLQHLVFAWKCAGALIVHGIFPKLLETYASDRICKNK